MGIATPFARLLVEARRAGARFGRTLTIGRQSMCIPEEELRVLLGHLDLPPALAAELACEPWAEPFVQRVLGAGSVASLDHSAYQGATIVHDLNRPLPPELHARFDALIDGGAMEHVFDVRQVLASYMQLLGVGGRVFISVPANNLFGHGFYQFSSDLFYRVFSAENGFALRRMTLTEAPLFTVEASRNWSLYETRDPAEVEKRVRLVGRKPLLVNLHAERIAEVEPFRTFPIQSSFERSWAKDPGSARAGPSAPAAGFRYLGWWEELRRRIQERRLRSLRNRRFFRRLERLPAARRDS